MLETKRYLNCALTDAINKRDFRRVKKLVAEGANVNAADKYGLLPLVEAVRRNHEHIFLKDRRPKLYADDKKEESIAEYLVLKGADCNAKEDKRQGHTALIQAVCTRDLTFVQFLISNGAKVEVRDNEGFTPLLVAVETDELYLTQYLVSINANVFAKNNDGQDVIALARGKRVKKFLVETLREKVCRVLNKIVNNDLARFIASYVY